MFPPVLLDGGTIERANLRRPAGWQQLPRAALETAYFGLIPRQARDRICDRTYRTPSKVDEVTRQCVLLTVVGLLL